MNATRVGIISMPTNGRPTRSVPRGASCVCDSSSSAASISEKMRRQRSRNKAPSAVSVMLRVLRWRRRRLAAGPRLGRRRVAALLAPRRSGFVAEEPALTVARESAAPVLARLPVAEHALPLVARPVPLVWVVVAGLVDGIPAREPGSGKSADPGDDLEWAVPAPPVPAAVLARAARERLPRERGVRSSV